MGMSTKRTYGKAFAVPVQKRPFKPFPQNTTPMVLYRTPSQFSSLTNPRQGRIWPEKKNVDTPGSIGNLSSSQWSEVDLLNGIGNGAGNQQRVGRKVQLKSLLFRWVSSSSATACAIRILIVYDKQTDGRLAVAGDILEPTNIGFNSPMNMGNTDRFVVLADEVSEVQAINSSIPLVTRSGKIYRKINLQENFQTTTDQIGDISSGAILVMCCAISGVAGAGIGYYSRIRYTDV